MKEAQNVEGVYNNEQRMQQQGDPIKKSDGRMQPEADSPRQLQPQDIFELMLEDQSDKLNHVEDSPKVYHQGGKKMMVRDHLKKMLKSSSSNENLIPEMRNDSSMDIEDPNTKNFQTENSQDDESVRHFKKRAEESFSIEYASRREDSSESFSERSDSRSHRNNFVYRMDEEDSRHAEEPKKEFMGCNCKRSKCIKLYCECFHLKVFCTEACKCHSCANRKDNEAEHKKAIIEALARNPKAFEGEQEPEPNNELNSNIFSLGFQKEEIRKGCKCKKTKCLKKYCECYSSGEQCGIFCRCEDCENKQEFREEEAGQNQAARTGFLG